MMGFLVVITVYTVWRSFAEAARGEFFEDYSSPECLRNGDWP